MKYEFFIFSFLFFYFENVVFIFNVSLCVRLMRVKFDGQFQIS